jgi:hypothetical protein
MVIFKILLYVRQLAATARAERHSSAVISVADFGASMVMKES